MYIHPETVFQLAKLESQERRDRAAQRGLLTAALRARRADRQAHRQADRQRDGDRRSTPQDRSTPQERHTVRRVGHAATLAACATPGRPAQP
jgi:hypothetical protein